jgi:hypothetical protein
VSTSNHAMTTATAFIRTLQNDNVAAKRSAQAQAATLKLANVRKSKEVEASRNELTAAMSDVTAMQAQVSALTMQNQSLESLLRARDLELDRYSRGGYVAATDGYERVLTVALAPRSLAMLDNPLCWVLCDWQRR